MKYCLRSRVAPKYLIHADEIRVDYRDRESIDTLANNYPNATIILNAPVTPLEYFDWTDIVRYDALCQHKFIINASSITMAKDIQAHGFKFMINTEVTSMWELHGMANLGAEYAYIGIPLFFSIKDTLHSPLKLRAIPNVAYNHTLPHETGINGQWIRPEDVEWYEGYIDVFEFDPCPVEKEEALYRIYAMRQKWDQQLDLLVEDLGASPLNRLIDPALVERRLSCKQVCEAGGSCKLCFSALNLAKEDLTEKIKKVVTKDKEAKIEK